MPIRDEAINVFMGLPGDGDRLELTYNFGVDAYELGTGYNHIAVTVRRPRRRRSARWPRGDRAREAAVHGPRGRLAAVLRARPRRLPLELIERRQGSFAGSAASTRRPAAVTTWRAIEPQRSALDAGMRLSAAASPIGRAGERARNGERCRARKRSVDFFDLERRGRARAARTRLAAERADIDRVERGSRSVAGGRGACELVEAGRRVVPAIVLLQQLKVRAEELGRAIRRIANGDNVQRGGLRSRHRGESRTDDDVNLTCVLRRRSSGRLPRRASAARSIIVARRRRSRGTRSWYGDLAGTRAAWRSERTPGGKLAAPTGTVTSMRVARRAAALQCAATDASAEPPHRRRTERGGDAGPTRGGGIEASAAYDAAVERAEPARRRRARGRPSPRIEPEARAAAPASTDFPSDGRARCAFRPSMLGFAALRGSEAAADRGSRPSGPQGVDARGAPARRHRPRVELVPPRRLHRPRDGWWKRTDEIYEPVRIGEGQEDGRAAAARADGARAGDDRAVRALLPRDGDRAASGRSRRRRSARRRTARTSCARRASAPGSTVQVLPREEEARYGYLAAVNSTTLADGVALDIGGGSMQLTHVADRRARDARSWRLGAVVMTERFLADATASSQAAQGAARARPRRARAAPLARRDQGAAGRGRRHRPQPRGRGDARRGAAAFGVQGFAITRDALDALVERARRADAAPSGARSRASSRRAPTSSSPAPS